MLNMQL